MYATTATLSMALTARQHHTKAGKFARGGHGLHSKALAKYVYRGQRQAAEIPIYGYCAYGLNLLLLQR